MAERRHIAYLRVRVEDRDRDPDEARTVQTDTVKRLAVSGVTLEVNDRDWGISGSHGRVQATEVKKLRSRHPRLIPGHRLRKRLRCNGCDAVDICAVEQDGPLPQRSCHVTSFEELNASDRVLGAAQPTDNADDWDDDELPRVELHGQGELDGHRFPVDLVDDPRPIGGANPQSVVPDTSSATPVLDLDREDTGWADRDAVDVATRERDWSIRE